jgi:serine/threonine-protein kinase
LPDANIAYETGLAWPLGPDVPAFIGKYELLNEINRGGMGVVYHAYDPELKRHVALKVLKAGSLAGPEDCLRFSREAQATARLQHPHIVPLHEVGWYGQQPYFVMALAAGGSLAHHLGRFSKDLRAAVALAEKVARAVHYAHTKGVWHRDLKPGNVLLDERDEPLVTDFGLAKLVSEDDGMTKTGQVLGTAAYMAPEQAAGEISDISERSDVWSLGVLLFELLTGQRPFKGKSNELIRLQIIRTPVPRVRGLRRGLPHALETITLKCLEKDVRRRYPSALALADDLGRWLRGEPPLARPAPWPVRCYREMRRRPWRSTAALTLAAVASVAAVMYLNDPQRTLEAHARQLRHGQPVGLLSTAGVPGWYEIVEGPAAVVGPDGQGNLRIDSWTETLVGLLPDPQVNRYRFRARVRHEASSEVGLAGLFFGCAKHPTAVGPYHSYFLLGFNDITDEALTAKMIQVVNPQVQNLVLPDGNHLHLIAEFYGRDASEHRCMIPTFLTRWPFPFADVPAAERPWRQLEVEVTPDSIRVFWEDKFVFSQDRETALAAFRKTLQATRNDKFEPWLGIQPPLAPRLELGLFVSYGSALFRDVELLPGGSLE